MAPQGSATGGSSLTHSNGGQRTVPTKQEVQYQCREAAGDLYNVLSISEGNKGGRHDIA